MAEHGPHCDTCTCGCTCGYGGQHEPDKVTCELNRGMIEAMCETPDVAIVADGVLRE